MPTSKKKDSVHYASYAERRANASMQMLAELSTGMSMWIDVGTKDDVSLSKTASDWKVFCANRATTTIDTTLHQLVQTLFQSTENLKYQDFMRAMWSETYLDARVIEVIGGDPESSAATNLALQRNNPSIFHKTHKRTSIKWFATSGKSKLSKAQEFHVVEFIGLVYDKNRIQAAYVYQESMAKTSELPLPHLAHVSTNYERIRVDGLLMKFEALELPTGGEYVLLSMALQRLPSLFDFGFKNPAEELVLRFAKGYRDALRRTSSVVSSVRISQIKFAQTASWVPDQERSSCTLCSRPFHALVRRRHHCRVCGEVICFQCSNLFSASSLPADPAQSTYIQGDVRLCNRCVVNQQAEAGRYVGVLSAEALHIWLDEELSENNPDLFDVTPAPPKRPLPSGRAFTGTLEVNALVSTPVMELSKKKSSNQTLPSPEDNNGEKLTPITLGLSQPEPQRSPRTRSPRITTAQTAQASDALVVPTTSSISLGASQRNFETEADESPPLQLISSYFTDSRSSSTSSHNTSSPTTSQDAFLTLPQSSNGQLTYAYTSPAPQSVQSRHNSHRRISSLDLPREFMNRPLQIDPKYLPRRQLPPLPPSHFHRHHASNVRAASSWAGVTTSTGAAVAFAMRDLQAKIGQIHFLVVSFSDACDAIDVMAALEYEAPCVPYIGGLSARGICDESAWISMKHDGLVAIWGIHDPHGVYAVGSASYIEANAKVEAYDATCITRGHMGPEQPAFCLMYACPLVVDEALAGIRQAVDCPVLGGCSVLSTQYQGYLQISSAGGTSVGMAIALCSPSVETEVGWFSGYEAVHPTNCVGVVTAADPITKLVYQINNRPAAEVYREWLSHVNAHDIPTKFPRLGYMYPLGQVVEDSPQIQVNSTPVVTALDDLSGAVSTTTPITLGTKVALMRTSSDLLKQAVRKMGYDVQQNQKFALAEMEGCLMFLSAGVQVVLGSSSSMTGLIGAFKGWSGGAGLLGLTSFGEIGHLGNERTPQCDALMFSWLVFSNRRRKTVLT